MSKEISCKEVRKYICQCLATDVGSARCRALKKHLDDCNECQDYFKSVELTIECYQKYDVQIPEDAHKRLMDFLELNDK